MPSRTRLQLLALGLNVAAAACTSSPPEGTGGGNTGGSAFAALAFDAGAAGEGFGPVAVGAGGDDGELFFSQGNLDAGYQFFLQHLSSKGAASQGWVALGSGTPLAPPSVAVDSDGKEVTCCWEDWGGINGSHTKGQVIRCNSVPPGGNSPDATLSGGFSDLGSRPTLAHGATTVVAYTETKDTFVTETLLYEGLASITIHAPYVLSEWLMAPQASSFDLFVSDGTNIEVSQQGPALQNDGHFELVSGNPNPGSFALATNSVLTVPGTTAILAHQAASVTATLFGPTTPPTVTVSASGEAPLDPLAAATCNATTYGLAYALAGGEIAFRSMGADATLGAEHLISTGFASETSLSMASVDGGVLLAAGNESQISVFFVPCP